MPTDTGACVAEVDEDPVDVAFETLLFMLDHVLFGLGHDRYVVARDALDVLARAARG